VKDAQAIIWADSAKHRRECFSFSFYEKNATLIL
jgi:hypothetical protein